MGDLFRIFVPNTTAIQKLSLEHCYQIPKEIGLLSNLETLDIHHCYSLSFPSSELQNLTKLERLSIRDCKGAVKVAISSASSPAPSPAAHMTTTKKKKHDPHQILSLHLKTLILSNCNQPSIMGDLFRLFPNIERLSLDGRCAEKIPKEIGVLSNLESLHIRCNWGYSLNFPPEIRDLTKLRRLSIRDCKASVKLPSPGSSSIYSNKKKKKHDVLPAAWSHHHGHQHLKTLVLNNCRPSIMGNLFRLFPEIQELSLDCCCGDEIPREIGIFKDLESLDIRDFNTITKVPIEIQKLTKLNSLSISNCRLLRDLPVPIHKLPCLKTFSLTYCSRVDFKTFSSFITNAPSPCGDEKNDGAATMPLNSLVLKGNSLRTQQNLKLILKQLWAFVAKCPKLQVLDLSDNNFTSLDDFAGLFLNNCSSSSNNNLLRILRLRDSDDNFRSLRGRDDDDDSDYYHDMTNRNFYNRRYSSYSSRNSTRSRKQRQDKAKQLAIGMLEQHFQLCDTDIMIDPEGEPKVRTLMGLNASAMRLVGEMEKCRSLWPFLLAHFMNDNEHLSRAEKLDYVYDKLRNGRMLFPS